MFDPEKLRVIQGGLGEEKESPGEEKKLEKPGVENEKGEKNELQEKIKQEKKEAKEKFGSLINLVSRGYEKLPEAMKKDYILHNEEILDGAIELGMEKGFTKEELEELELSAILHDKTKAESAPEEYKDIPNYTLATHAETVAKEVPNILADEYLKSLNIQGSTVIPKKPAILLNGHGQGLSAQIFCATSCINPSFLPLTKSGVKNGIP